MRSRFQQGLDELKEKLLRMGGLAEQAIDRANEAYRTRDSKFCQMVFSGEPAINDAEREIDELALDLLACSSRWRLICVSSWRWSRSTPIWNAWETRP
ncbi:MAG TPA: PhoU domain-containing protein [Terracidiphilus sp.]